MSEETELPIGFEIVVADWYGDGAVHNYENPCSYAPESGDLSDLATVSSENRTLCEYCDWPDGATEALAYGN